jgi:pSer/pThr/pTyr-binding forkhead associated (FHA) protein
MSNRQRLGRSPAERKAIPLHVQLTPVQGGETIHLAKDITLVGRKEGTDLRLNHKTVSKHHCVLVKAEGMLLVRDLGSTNGTRVNGKRIRRAALMENEQLSIAGFGFRVHFTQQSPAAVNGTEVTQQISPEEAEHLLQQKSPVPGAPVVRVNTLPDELTQVPDDGNLKDNSFH